MVLFIMEKIILLLVLVIILIVYLKSKSSFSSTLPYSPPSPVPPDCTFPRGHLPGSNIILTDSEKMNLLQVFANNGPELI
jgi:hypothetical protein